jgi:RNA ligase (TIGR02306 family)
MRNLASIRTISAINPHTNADALELAVIDGWTCVIKKGEFTAGDAVVYFEIDSFIPTAVAPFLTKPGKTPKTFEGIEGERLRTMRLRGELSQGLVLRLTTLPTGDYTVGMDVTETLGVRKWEKPMNPQLAGLARGNFPPFIRKTDQERIQNIFHKLTPEQIADTYEVTLKLDGSSATYFVNGEHTGVCSRNLELQTDESNAENTFVKKFYELDLDGKLTGFNLRTGRNIAVQGELWGAGINGNWEGIADHRYNVFDVYDIDTQKYVSADDRLAITGLLGLDHAPRIEATTLQSFTSVDDFLAYADRASIYNPVAEGVVFKSLTNPDFSFKAINNKYLLNGGE